MKKVLISEFKAKCIGMIKEVHETGKPLLITRRGKPMVKVEPAEKTSKLPVLGAQKGSITILGDIVNTDFSDDWEMNQE